MNLLHEYMDFLMSLMYLLSVLVKVQKGPSADSELFLMIKMVIWN